MRAGKDDEEVLVFKEDSRVPDHEILEHSSAARFTTLELCTHFYIRLNICVLAVSGVTK